MGGCVLAEDLYSSDLSTSVVFSLLGHEVRFSLPWALTTHRTLSGHRPKAVGPLTMG